MTSTLPFNNSAQVLFRAHKITSPIHFQFLHQVTQKSSTLFTVLMFSHSRKLLITGKCTQIVVASVAYYRLSCRHVDAGKDAILEAIALSITVRSAQMSPRNSDHHQNYELNGRRRGGMGWVQKSAIA